MRKKWRRSKLPMFGGVISGFSEYINKPILATPIRVLFIAICFTEYFPWIIGLYLFLWIILKENTNRYHG